MSKRCVRRPPHSMKLLTINVGNPSPTRAERQLAWLSGRSDDVLVLSELGTGSGSTMLVDCLAVAGYATIWQKPPADERGVLLATRLEVADALAGPAFLPWRASAAVFQDSHVVVVGVYVPSRDASPEKTERKRRFLVEMCRWLDGLSHEKVRLVIGDFNLLDRHHVPRHGFFGEWEYAVFDTLSASGLVDAFRLVEPNRQEYSWIDRGGEGYRFDHCLVDRVVATKVRECSYLHETRQGGLTDHSAMELDINMGTTLKVRQVGPITALQPSLFDVGG